MKRLVPEAPTVPVRDIFRRFWPFARPLRRWLFVALLLTATGPALEAATIWLFKVLIDQVLVPRDFGPFGWLAAAYLGMTLARGAPAGRDDQRRRRGEPGEHPARPGLRRPEPRVRPLLPREPRGPRRGHGRHPPARTLQPAGRAHRACRRARRHRPRDLEAVRWPADARSVAGLHDLPERALLADPRAHEARQHAVRRLGRRRAHHRVPRRAPGDPRGTPAAPPRPGPRRAARRARRLQLSGRRHAGR